MGNIAVAWEYFANVVASIRFRDVVDILIVSVLLFYVYRFIRERRAGKLAIGVAFLILCQILASIFDLAVMGFILENIFQVGLIALLIVFQPELRSFLENMGSGSIRGLKNLGGERDPEFLSKFINELCEALSDLSENQTGALIVIERSTKLGEIISTGSIINADTSELLIKNIFFPKSPLHDGAVVIRDGRIYAAGCLLPLTKNNDFDRALGTRHRAAVGMSEISDAIVLVVSEETGVISVARSGKLERYFDYNRLRIVLDEEMGTNGIKQRFSRFSRKSREEQEENGNGK